MNWNYCKAHIDEHSPYSSQLLIVPLKLLMINSLQSSPMNNSISKVIMIFMNALGKVHKKYSFPVNDETHVIKIVSTMFFFTVYLIQRK